MKIRVKCYNYQVITLQGAIMSDYNIKIEDISDKPKMPTTLHKLTSIVISRRRVDVYMDKAGQYWRATSKSIKVS